MKTETSPRMLSESPDFDTLRYDSAGLIPVIAQDRDTGAVLMMAWANREALERTLDTGDLHFWSRSRGELWRKGATSGNVLRETELLADCDRDAVLARVRPSGPACHTGEVTCFGAPPPSAGAASPLGRVREAPLTGVSALAATLEERMRDRPEGSYTVRLLDDDNLRYKKLGEETAELVAALASGATERGVEEATDLIYHLVVAVLASGRSWSEVEDELARRAGGP